MDQRLADLFALFYDESYEDGLELFREELAASHEHPEDERSIAFLADWERLKKAVRDRSLPPGEAFAIVRNGANRVLEQETDDAAYRWLELTIKNAERTDGKIDEY